MTTLSLRLADSLAMESSRTAKELGISRTEFIRRALTHELERIQREKEIEEMRRAARAMAADPDYLREAEELDEGLYDPIGDEEDEEWWTTP